MAETIILNLPKQLDDSIRRMAHATRQPVETLLVSALQAYLPSLEGLPHELAQELIELESDDNTTLRQVMDETVSPAQVQAIQELLNQQQVGTLTPDQAQHLSELQRAADRIMLRRARAAAPPEGRSARRPTRTDDRTRHRPHGHPGAARGQLSGPLHSRADAIRDHAGTAAGRA